MKKLIIRYPISWKKLYLKKGKNIVNINGSIVKKKHGIHAIIKFSNSDFKLIKKNVKKLTHFNIQYSGHKTGKKYLIVKIARQGYFDGKSNNPPILNSSNFILAKCINARNNVKYENLNDRFFKNSLSNIKNVYALKKVMKRRYKKSLAHLSDSEKLSLGIAITELKIIKRFSQI